MEPAHNNSFPLSESDLIRFIRLYKKQSVLWDTDHPLCRKKLARKRALEYIIRSMDIPGFEMRHAQLKIRSYRDMYLREKKKNTGMNKLWMQELKFLEGHLHTSTKSQKKVHKVESDDDDDSKSVTAEHEDYHEILVVQNEDDEAEETYLVTEKRTSASNEEIDKLNTTSNTCPTRSQDQVLQSIEHKQDAILKMLREKEAKDKYIDNFSEYVSCLLKSMPKSKAYAIKPKIIRMILEEIANDNNKVDK